MDYSSVESGFSSACLLSARQRGSLSGCPSASLWGPMKVAAWVRLVQLFAGMSCSKPVSPCCP